MGTAVQFSMSLTLAPASILYLSRENGTFFPTGPFGSPWELFFLLASYTLFTEICVKQERLGKFGVGCVTLSADGEEGERARDEASLSHV